MSPREARLARPVLRTARLTLRPLQMRHAAELFEAVDADRAWLRRWVSFPDRTRSPRDTAGFIDRMARADQNIVWGLWLTGPGRRGTGLPASLCGSIGLHHLERERAVAFLGYWIARAVAGRGLATEAGAAVLLWAFDALRLERVAAEAAAPNAASLRVIEKLGFAREGRLRSAEKLPGRRQRVDWFLHGLVRADLRSTRARWARQCGTRRPWEA